MNERAICRLKSRNHLLVHWLALFIICEAGMVGSVDLEAANRPVQQALLIVIALIDGRPDSQEVKSVYKMEDELSKAIEHSRAGEYDGSEIGKGTFTMYMYGPSADKLFEVVRPVLAQYRFAPGSRAVKRYGDPGAKEERIALDHGTAN
jgi:hypothetical protein